MTTLPSFTLRYGAPELHKEEVFFNETIDVYSFGVIVYELVTGKFAFRGLNQFQLMNRVLNQQRREPIPSTVAPFAKDLIERCWLHTPAERPSFSEICSLLRHKAHMLFPETDLEVLREFSTYLKQMKIYCE